MLCRLDYCNSVQSSLPRSTTEPLQRVHNAAVVGLDHVSSALKPSEHRIIRYKLCLLIPLSAHQKLRSKSVVQSRNPVFDQLIIMSNLIGYQNEVWRAKFLFYRPCRPEESTITSSLNICTVTQLRGGCVAWWLSGRALDLRVTACRSWIQFPAGPLSRNIGQLSRACLRGR